MLILGIVTATHDYHYVTLSAGRKSQHIRKYDIRKRRSFADSRMHIPYKTFLGYDDGKEGKTRLTCKKQKWFVSFIRCI